MVLGLAECAERLNKHESQRTRERHNNKKNERKQGERAANSEDTAGRRRGHPTGTHFSRSIVHYLRGMFRTKKRGHPANSKETTGTIRETTGQETTGDHGGDGGHGIHGRQDANSKEAAKSIRETTGDHGRRNGGHGFGRPGCFYSALENL